MQKIFLTKSQKQILANHAEKEKPNEACAILFGTTKEGETKVKKIFLTKNIEESPINFTISAEERLEADKIERETGWEIIGIFHSHPSSEAFPSDTDKKYMELNPGIWVIFSGNTLEFRAFVLNKKIIEIAIVT